MGFAAMRQRAVHDCAGIASTLAIDTAPRRTGGNPLGGWTGLTGAGLWRASALAQGWAGAYPLAAALRA
jgi:hypothetical protein